MLQLTSVRVVLVGLLFVVVTANNAAAENDIVGRKRGKSIYSNSALPAQQHLARTASRALMSFRETAVGLWFINVEEGATQNVPN